MSKQDYPLSKNLKKLREKRGLSQDRLAKLADIANNTISLTPKFGQCGKIEKTAKIYAAHKKISVPGFKSKSSFGAHSGNRHNFANLLQV